MQQANIGYRVFFEKLSLMLAVIALRSSMVRGCFCDAGIGGGGRFTGGYRKWKDFDCEIN